MSNVPVVTLFEAYGSGASYVGPRVAEALGVPFMDQAFSSKQLEDQEAQRPPEPQEGDGPFGRFLAQVGKLGAGLDADSIPWDQADDDKMREENIRSVKEQAAAGGVILGRNGAKILSDLPKALHVLLEGTLDDRIKRAAKEGGIDLVRAAKRQRHEDQVRADMSLRLHHWDPRDPAGYDIVVNTSKFGLDGAVKIIVDAFNAKQG